MSGGQTGGWGPPRCPHNLQCREEVGGWPGREPAPQPSPAAPRPPEACSGHARARPTPGPPLSAAPPGRAEGDTQHCRKDAARAPRRSSLGCPILLPKGPLALRTFPNPQTRGPRAQSPTPRGPPSPYRALPLAASRIRAGEPCVTPWPQPTSPDPPAQGSPPGGSGVWRLFCLDGSERDVQPRVE